MVEFELKYVDVQRARDRSIKYYYFRRGGRRWRLPGTPLDAAFMAEYHSLLASTTTAKAESSGFVRGTLGALVDDYLKSAAYKGKKDSTRAEYKRVLSALQTRYGSEALIRLRRRHIRYMRDDRAETPGAANTILRMMKLILSFAVDEELITVNPAAKMKELKVGEWRDWTEEECQKFEKRWKPGTMQRRAYALALYTGQRKGDMLQMTRAHRQNGLIRVKQSKADEELWIPEHSELKAELARGPQDHMSLLTTTEGKSFHPVYFTAWFADAIDDAGLPDDCVLHGLRKSSAQALAEAGCSEREIMAIIGHRTTRMVSHYTKRADKKRLAKAAILKLERAQRRKIAKRKS